MLNFPFFSPLVNLIISVFVESRLSGATISLPLAVKGLTRPQEVAGLEMAGGLREGRTHWTAGSLCPLLLGLGRSTEPRVSLRTKFMGSVSWISLINIKINFLFEPGNVL